jgi:hypothetical protein
VARSSHKPCHTNTNLPARFSFVPSHARWHFGEETIACDKLAYLEFSDELELLIPQNRGQALAHRPALDPWRLRERFLRLKRSDADLLRFLNDTGRWDKSLGPHRVQNIWSWQEAISDLLLHPSRDWQETISEHLNPHVGFMGLAAYLDLAFEFSAGSVWLDLMPCGCVGALLGTVLIDRSEGVRFKVCRRPDCHVLYRIETQHKRKYCSYDCAHLQSVRNSRKRNRLARNRRA